MTLETSRFPATPFSLPGVVVYVTVNANDEYIQSPGCPTAWNYRRDCLSATSAKIVPIRGPLCAITGLVVDTRVPPDDEEINVTLSPTNSRRSLDNFTTEVHPAF